MPYISGEFNRRTFNPELNPLHRKTLNTLRQVGRSRAWHCLNEIRYPNWPSGRKRDSNHFWCCGSSALKALWFGFQTKCEREGAETYIDIGCGDSPDILIAAYCGFNVYGIDLFPPSPDSDMADLVKQCADGSFIRADALLLPFQDCTADFVSSQAMIALVKPSKRLGLYKEVCRILKIGGEFSLTGVELKCGYGWRQAEEGERARKVSVWDVESIQNGFRATRTE